LPTRTSAFHQGFRNKAVSTKYLCADICEKLPHRIMVLRSQGGTQQKQGEYVMAAIADTAANVPWWKEPTRDQWKAFIAAWLGWTLDAFDFTIFLLIMLPISQEFGVPLTAVTAPSRSDGSWLDGGPHGPQGAADDLHPVVLAL
jgi:hypothetical protein